MHKREGRTPTQRQLRVGEEIRHVLAQTLGRGELRDPDLVGRTITVTEVRISPDLKNATAFIVPLGGEHSTEVLVALRRGAGYLRGIVAHALRLRYAPHLGFELDRSFDRGPAHRRAAAPARGPAGPGAAWAGRGRGLADA